MARLNNDMTLAQYIKLNYDPSMESCPDSQEHLLWTICDFLSSYNYRSSDSKYLKRHGLRKSDFS